MLYLQPRDNEILRYCYEHGFLLMEQVRRYFFKNVGRREGYRRVNELIKAGFLKKEQVIALSRFQVLRVTRLGARIAEGAGSYEALPQNRSLDPVTLFHDSLVISVRLRLKELWDAEWTPEAVLKLEKLRHIPDGVLLFPSGKKFIVEVEHTQKEHGRFQRLLRHWRDDPDRPYVLYIATGPSLFKFIKKELACGPADIAAVVALWSDLEAGTPQVWSTQGEIDLFNRRTL